MGGRTGVEGLSPARLRAARRALGISQRELGKRASLSLNSICSYEGGTQKPDAPALRRLADQLGVDVLDLLDPDIPVTLAVLRWRAGCRQRDLAVRVGVSRSHVAELETGLTALQPGMASRLAAALSDDLLTVTEADVISAYLAEHPQTLPPIPVEIPGIDAVRIRTAQLPGEEFRNAVVRIIRLGLQHHH